MGQGAEVRSPSFQYLRCRVKTPIDDDHDAGGYGLVNGVTHYSHQDKDYDRATEFEALGGKLIKLPFSEWQELAEAA